MKRRLLTCLLISSFSAGSFAGTNSEIDIELIKNQTDLANLVKDLGAALSYKAISPAENLDLIGFDVGIEVSRTSMETDALEIATGAADAPSDLIVPKLHAHIGIPFVGIDLGAFISSIPDSNMSVFGGEIKYSFIDGSTVMPALSIRGTFSNLSGVDNFELNTRGLELSVSKGFLMFTPYATIGIIRATGKSNSTVYNLSKETEDLQKIAFGVNINLGLINFDLETDKTGDNSTASFKFGFRF